MKAARRRLARLLASVSLVLALLAAAPVLASFISARSTATGLFAAATRFAPRATAPPSVSGTAQQGQTLTATPGTWLGAPSGYTYQWRDCDTAGSNCSDIAGATGSSHLVSADDVGATIRVLVTAVNAGGPASSSSSAVGPVIGGFSEFTAGLSAGAVVNGPVAGPDGNVWFTDSGATAAIGRITPSGAIAEYTAGLNAGARPLGLAAGADGNLWFADRGATPAIGRITPGGTITEYSAGLNPGSAPEWIAAGVDGGLWFTDGGTTAAIGRIDPSTGAVTEYSAGLEAGSAPEQIAAGPDGDVWFVDRGSTPAIGRITPTGEITEYSAGLPAGSVPTGLSAGADGNLWFTDQGPAPALGRVTPSGAITEYGAGARWPRQMGLGADGNVWFGDWTTGWAAIGRITPSGAVSEFPTAAFDANLGVQFAVGGGDGEVYFNSDSGAERGVIGRFAIGAPENTTPPAITGTLQAGRTLTATRGSWSGSPQGFGYQWERCVPDTGTCLPIAGASAATHVVASADAGHTLEVLVTATNGVGPAGAHSSPTATFIPAPLNTAPPALSGVMQQGQTLTATTGTWANGPSGYAYQWQDCDASASDCTDIAGATSASYTPTGADVGLAVVVSVTATNAGGSVSASSPPAGLVIGSFSELSAGLSPGAAVGEPVAGPDGNVWFADTGTTHAIGRVTPAGSVTEFATGLNAGAAPFSIAAGADGNLWFTDRGSTPAIGRITPNGSITEFSAGLSAGSLPAWITAGADGDLWFTDQGAAPAIGRVDPTTGAITEYSAGLNPGAVPNVITGGPDGNVWFTDAGTTHAIGRITPAGAIAEYTAGLNAGSVPNGIVAGTDGNLWFTDSGSTPAVGTVDPSTAAIAEYTAGLDSPAGMRQMGVGADGNVWFGDWTTGWAAIGRITPSGAVSEFPTAAFDANLGVQFAVGGPDGDVYFNGNAGADVGLIGRFSIGAPASTAPPTIAGTVEPGQTVTAVRGTWKGSPNGFSYRWRRCSPETGTCLPIAGATSDTYLVADADAGRTLQVVVTATNAVGPASAYSVPVGPPIDTAPPTISGTMQQGQTLSASAGTWVGYPAPSYSYQWQACDGGGANCSNIAGATASSYVPLAADAGARIRVVVTASNSAASVSASSAAGVVVIGSFSEYTAGLNAGAAVSKPAAGTDGNVWFTDSGTTPALGRITPTGAITEFSAGLDPGARPSVVAAGPDGNMWFTDAGTSAAIGRITPNGTITEYSAGLNAGSRPSWIAAGADGNLWFTDAGTTPAIGRINPSSGAITEFSAGLNPGASPGAIALGADGNVWFVDRGPTMAIGRITPAGAITEYSAGLNAGASPNGLSAGADGNLWFTDQGTTMAIGRITPAGAITEYPGTTFPRQIGAGADGNAWFGDWATGWAAIARITPAGAISEFATGAFDPNVGVQFATGGPDGDVYFNSNGASSHLIARFSVGAPANTAAPTVAGTVQQGQTLTAAQGSWSGSPSAYAYQWRRCAPATGTCTAIAGATSGSYIVAAADAGDAIQVVVSATNAVGLASAYSVPVGPPVSTALPAISGTAQAGQMLTAAPGAWTASPSLSYQWQDCNGAGSGCVNIAGATASSYQAGASDAGQTIRVVVTAVGSSGTTSAASAATAPILLAPANTSAPTISGTAQQGQALSAASGSWIAYPAPTFAYQWQDCNGFGTGCVNIAGATSSGYVPGAGDLGDTIRVVVTATNAVGSAAATSSQTAIVTVAPTNTALPAISGTVQQGKALSATSGTWTGYPAPTFTYQWQRCNSSGSGCANISGATAATYTLVSADVNATIRVAVTASNSAGSATATSSATVSVLIAAPVNTSPPSIYGTPFAGSTASAAGGGWNNSPTSFSYTWYRCDASGNNCTQVGTGTSYLVPSGTQWTTTLRVVQAATNAGGSASATSAYAMVAGPPVNTVAPVISNFTYMGTASVSNGTWLGTPTSFTYQWYYQYNYNGSLVWGPIYYATSSTFSLGTFYYFPLYASVTASNSYGSATANSPTVGPGH